MEFGLNNYYILGEIISCVLCFILICNILITFSFYDKKQRFFAFCTLSTFLSSLFDIFSVICIENYKTIPLWICEFCSTVYFITLMSIPFFILNYGREIILTNKPRIKRGFSHFLYTLYALYFIVILINIKTGWIFKFDIENGYIRGSLRYLSYVYTVFTTVLLVLIAVINRKTMALRVFAVFLFYPFISFLFILIQFFNPQILLTGISAFSSLFFAYIAIQSDLIDFDSVTGLMTENKLIKYFDSRKFKGVIYIFSIENMNFIQSNISNSKKNFLLLSIAKELSKYFEKNTFSFSSNGFAALGKTEIEIKEKIELFEQFIQKLNYDQNFGLPIPLDYYSTAISFSTQDSYESIMNIAQTMIKKSKHELNHSLQFCDSKILSEIERKKQIFSILQRELNVESTQFQIYFQPIYSIKDNKITHLEALSRLNGTELGNISPAEFIPIAESKGLIEKLGMVAFEKVCKFMSEHKNAIQSISVNFSVYQMTNKNLVEKVIKIVEKYNLLPQHLIMEITESIFIDNYEVVRENMEKLTDFGIQFYLDDFGTGYSNLSNVVQLPFSTIKMDRSFVLMIEEDSKKGLSLFTNLVETFKDAGLEVLVEGVETDIQKQLVIQSDCDYIQGFLYSHPLDSDSIIKFLR